jgi:hypothetical protein
MFLKWSEMAWNEVVPVDIRLPSRREANSGLPAALGRLALGTA